MCWWLPQSKGQIPLWIYIRTAALMFIFATIQLSCNFSGHQTCGLSFSPVVLWCLASGLPRNRSLKMGGIDPCKIIKNVISSYLIRYMIQYYILTYKLTYIVKERLSNFIFIQPSINKARLGYLL